MSSDSAAHSAESRVLEEQADGMQPRRWTVQRDTESGIVKDHPIEHKDNKMNKETSELTQNKVTAEKR